VNDIHVWFGELDVEPQWVDRLSLSLSDDERARAARFHFVQHQRRFAVARGILRDVLGRYVGCEADRVVFAYDTKGKPMLAAGCGDGTVQFNLSHSQGLSLIAVTRGRAVGVDIEQIRPIRDLKSLTKRCFSPQEGAAILALPVAQHLRAFFSCWTRKEAYLKALGDGLARPLDSFAVSVEPDGLARLLWASQGPEESSRWLLSGLVPAWDTIGAVAVPAQSAQLTCWTWSSDFAGFGT
jgi:4'-phosphopantetheinyl transferase